MLRRLGDGEDDKAQTIGGPLSGEVFSMGPIGNLFLGQQSNRHRDQLLTAHTGVAPESPGTSFLIDIGPADGGGGDGSSGGGGGDEGAGGGGEGTG